ncbi:MAG TPA: hypothetical protein DHW71_06335 [Gammaproteobacteria bacterium]|nr:hypothetical protein [Gammaproteobacteria bacterium]
MNSNIKKAALSFLVWGCLIAAGITAFVQDRAEKAKAEEAKQEALEKEKEKPYYPYMELMGSWQSECGTGYYDQPAIISVEIKQSIIRWANHFYDDKDCTRSDKTERYIFTYKYVDDVRILGEVKGKLFRLSNVPSDEQPENFDRLEVFKNESDTLYISDPMSGPEYDKPWDLASNFGLRRMR